MKIQEKVILSKYTSWKIGGPAKYFCLVSDKDEVEEAVRFAQGKGLPYFILGGGSNVLVSDKGYDGLVIKLNNQNIEIDKSKNTVRVGAGTSLLSLVNATAQAELTGLEWAMGIPGTVGGAIRGNAGSYDHCMADFVKQVMVLDEDLKEKNYLASDLQFAYRHSIFKNNQDIIFSANLQLEKSSGQEVKRLINNYLNLKKEKQPLTYPSAGCVFENPTDQNAAWLIDQCKLKGRQIGQAQISTKHPNFIINLGGAQAADVLELITLIKKEIFKKYNINLKEEIQIL